MPKQTRIYHITHLRNLASILRSRGLHAKGRLAGRASVDLAYESVQERRNRTRVPCGPGGVLHDYVPFYFGPRSPMLYALKGGWVEGYSEGQAPIVHLCTSAEQVDADGLGYVFTNGHAIMVPSDFYSDLADLDCVDLPLMSAKYWFDTQSDPDRKRRRQAEFLIHKFAPWELIDEIGVINKSTKAKVEAITASATHRPPIVVRKGWYY